VKVVGVEVEQDFVFGAELEDIIPCVFGLQSLVVGHTGLKT
jgi:hypothetical protein